MIPNKFHNFQLSKVRSIFEAEEKSEKKDGEPTVKYKENINIKEIPGGESAYKSYMGMFSEALSCLDAIYALSSAANSEAPQVKSFTSDRRDIGVSAGKREESVGKAWEKLESVAKKLLEVIPDAIKNNPVVNKYKAEKEKLAKEYKGKEDSGEYAGKLIKLRDVYSAQLNPDQITALTQIMKASKLYFDAIVIFKEGAKAEIDFIKGKSKENERISKEFFSRIGDSVESLVLSKRFAVKNVGQFESEIFEDLISGAKKIFGKSKDEPAGEIDSTNLGYSADNLMSSLISLAREIDNVIAWKSSVQGRNTKASQRAAEEAKSSASEMITFVRDSVKYVQDAQEKLPDTKDQTARKEIKKKLDEIADKVLVITRKDGILAKWKDQVLGEKREKTVSGSNLERGREKMFAAKQIISEVENAQKLRDKAKKYEPQELIKSAIRAFKGEPDERPSRVKKKSDYKTFPKDAGKEYAEDIKNFQMKLKDLGHLPSGYKEGELDTPTKEAMVKARKNISRITGKKYDDSDEGAKEFQQDFLFYGDNIDQISKMLK